MKIEVVFKLAFVAGALLTAGMANADVAWTRDVASGTGNWDDATNWSATPDPLVDVAYYVGPGGLYPNIEVTGDQQYGQELSVGKNLTPGQVGTAEMLFTIKSGGSLSQGVYNTGKYTMIAWNQDTHMVIEAGGYFSTPSRFYITKYGTAKGIVDVAGVLDLSVGYGKLYFGESTTSSTTGFLNVLDGGTVKLSTFADGVGGVELSKWDADSYIDIQGSGKMVAAGNSLTAAEAMINYGRVKGNGIVGNVTASYDSGLDETTVIAVTIAEPTCGDEDHPYPVGDFDQNCSVDFLDLVIFASDWLACTHPDGCL